MAKGEKGNGKEAVGKDVYLVKVDREAKTATVTRFPVGGENDKGETFYLVRNHAVKDLAEVAYPGKGGMIKENTEKNIRAQLSSINDFETKTVNIDVDKMESGKILKSGNQLEVNDEVEDEDNGDDSESQESVEVATPSYDTARF